MPQSGPAETELMFLPAVPYQIISPSKNAPIIGIFQDSLLGCFQFTRDNINMDQRDAMNLLMMFPNVDTQKIREKNANNITSFNILSQIMPPITTKLKTGLFKAEKTDEENRNNIMEIRNGEYMRGQLEKSMLGSSSKGILHRVCNDFGYMPCVKFIDNLQNVITEYMKTSSFSVGISDLIADQDTKTSILKIVADRKQEVQEVIDRVHIGTFENSSAHTNAQEFELKVTNILNKAQEQSGKKGSESLSKNNRFLKIVNSGSKGSLINISQMISCLGQQSIEGGRVPYGFDNRTLPHFCKYDDSPNARGFIESSYISGLSAHEMFFHAMAGRLGLIDTAVKTSETGYAQRKIVKSLEDIKVCYDMTVRNHMGKIVQFQYGEDSFDSTKVENQPIPIVTMSIEDIYMHYDLLTKDDATSESELIKIFTKSTVTRMRNQTKDLKTSCEKYIRNMIENRDKLVKYVFSGKNDSVVKLPVSFANLINNIQGQLQLGGNVAVDITPLEGFAMIEENYKKIMEYAPYIRENELFKIMYDFYLSPKDLLVMRRFHRKALETLLETVTLKFKQAIVHPGEMVGVIAAQSVGEPTTQLTLNSVTYETLLLVRKISTGEMIKVSIGDFTTEHIQKSKKIDYMADKDTTYAELSEEYEVPCSNEQGETVWRKIEAVTKHPVINEDGSNTMLKIETDGHREVIVTKAKSLLKLVDGKIIGVNGSTLRVGDYLPCSRKALHYNPQHLLVLKNILPPSEYIYGSEVEKARKVCEEHRWWMKHANKTFTLPYARSDSAYAMLNNTRGYVRKDGEEPLEYKVGRVYTKTNIICNYEIPEEIEMDYDFGYLVGAYCAEGCMTAHQVSISNNEQKYFEPIKNICKKFNLTTKIYVNENKNHVGWTSTDIRIYSTLMCRILENLCGKLSHNKFVSDKIVFSNEQCIRGFLDAYFGGDGHICYNNDEKSKTKDITVTSVSKEMLTDVRVMLTNINIHSKLRSYKKQEYNNRGTLPENIHQLYTLRITNKQCVKLANILNLKIGYKQEKVEKLREWNFNLEYSKFDDNCFPNEINGIVELQERNGRMMDLIFDKVVKIEEVQNTTSHAYDLTVEDTRNFNIYNELSLLDTFHNSGVASKANVTMGVPRIEEILRLTKNPKSPSLTVFLKELDQQDQDRAMKFANMIEHTRLQDIVSSVQIYFDPDDRATIIEEDREMLGQYYEYDKWLQNTVGGGEEKEEDNGRSKWLLRMEMNAEVMLEKNITMDDVHFAISNTYMDRISCVYSDYNEDKLIFRVRMLSDFMKECRTKPKKCDTTAMLDVFDDIYILKTFQENLLKKIVLRGVDGISKVIPRKLQNMVVKEDGKYVRKDTWILDTTGTNYLEVLGLPYIDYKRTYSNSIYEVFETLGIEAARQVILNELSDVMEFSGGVYINYHHLSLLCDRMTYSKDMVAVYRAGILNDNIGPIAKATFEMHTEMLLNAARHGYMDNMRGVSANVMCGQNGFFGTNSFQIYVDMKEMEKNTNNAQAFVPMDEEAAIENAFKKRTLEKSDMCTPDKIVIQNNLEAITATTATKAQVCDDDYDMGF